MTATPVPQSVPASPSSSLSASRGPVTSVVALIFVAEVLVMLLLQLPTTADFVKFAFYDQGAALRLDQLVAAGRQPTVDLGYSYGMLPLLAGRIWFFCFGRTPAAFIAFVTLCNAVSAIAIARFLAAVQPEPGARRIPWSHVAAACLLLPFAIKPDNYSLMHALEMACILLALSQLARGSYGSALAFATAALLTKPSMAYILGFLLLVTALARKPKLRAGVPAVGVPAVGVPPLGGSPQHHIQLPPPPKGGTPYNRLSPQKFALRLLIPPIAVLLAGIFIPALAVNPTAAIANIFPLTGARSYRLMNFGFFHAGRDFWLHASPTVRDALRYYFLTPAAFWIAATALLFVFALAAIFRLLRRRARRTDSLLLVVGLLHAAFIFLFYAWNNSWTYYAYLLPLGLLIAFAAPVAAAKKIWIVPLLLLCVVGYVDRSVGAVAAWRWWYRGPDTANLWAYDEMHEEWAAVEKIALSDPNQTLFLTNGALPLMFPALHAPEVWFLSPGILTTAELARVQSQIDHATRIVLFKEYDPAQELWNWPEFAAQRARFPRTIYDGPSFRILSRSTAPTR